MIATNSTSTYVLFLYEDINWANSATSIGFNAGDEMRGFNLPEASATQYTLNLENTSNVGIPGAYYFRVDQRLVLMPGQGKKCSSLQY